MSQDRRRPLLPLFLNIVILLALGIAVAALWRSFSPTSRPNVFESGLSLYDDNHVTPDDQTKYRSRAELVQQLAVAEYNVFLLKERERVLRWYRTSTAVTFWTVMVLTLSGLAMSWWQFRASLTPPSGRQVTDTDLLTSPPEDAWRHELKLKAHDVSLAIKTRSLAVLVMLFALAFFGLYLKYIQCSAALRVVYCYSCSPSSCSRVLTERTLRTFKPRAGIQLETRTRWIAWLSTLMHGICGNSDVNILNRTRKPII